MKKNHYKKIIVLSIFFIAVFFNFKKVFASVIYDNSLIGDNTYTVLSSSNSAMWSLGSGWSATTFINGTGITKLRLKILSGSCSSLMVGGSGSYFIITGGGGSGYPNNFIDLGGGICESDLSAMGDYNYWALILKTTGENVVLDGSINNLGYFWTNGFADKYNGGFAMQLCDSGGCSGGFAPSGPPATCSDGIQNQDETGIDVGGVCGFPPETCSDGIQNQNETGIDVGGVCFYVSLNWPENASTVPDFADWTVAYYGNDANETSPTLQKGVMWAENADILDTCLNYPSETATYNTCFNGTYPIYIDYGLSVWISASDYVSYITKTGTMTAGKTYFARAILYTIDDATNTRDLLISYSDKIGFIIDNTIGTGGETGKCKLTDLGCIFTAVLKTVFSPSQASLEQFGDFKTLLEQKAPFGYAIAIYSEITTLHYDANSTVLVLDQVPQITTLIFTPLRTGLAWLFWFAFAFFLVKRFKDINI